MTLLLLLACSADFLNIPIPPKGARAIHQEDIKRDIWSIERGNTAERWWEKRLDQLDGKMVVQNNSSCLIHEGEEKKGLIYWTSLNENDLGIRLATMLSLAKASNQVHLKFSYRYCLGEPVEIQGWTLIEVDNIAGPSLECNKDPLILLTATILSGVLPSL